MPTWRRGGAGRRPWLMAARHPGRAERQHVTVRTAGASLRGPVQLREAQVLRVVRDGAYTRLAVHAPADRRHRPPRPVRGLRRRWPGLRAPAAPGVLDRPDRSGRHHRGRRGPGRSRHALAHRSGSPATGSTSSVRSVAPSRCRVADESGVRSAGAAGRRRLRCGAAVRAGRRAARARVPHHDGARCRHCRQALRQPEARRIADECTFATDDGSVGVHGRVTAAFDPLARVHRRGLRLRPDGHARRRSPGCAKTAGVPSYIAVEEAMACGIGVCMTCVLPVRPRRGGTPQATAARRAHGPGLHRRTGLSRRRRAVRPHRPAAAGALASPLPRPDTFEAPI